MACFVRRWANRVPLVITHRRCGQRLQGLGTSQALLGSFDLGDGDLGRFDENAQLAPSLPWGGDGPVVRR